jgi:hypothetical protein
MKFPPFSRFKFSLAHILGGFPAFLLGTLLFWNPFVGAFAVFCVYWSREKCQHQYKLKGDASTSTVWNKGWSSHEWEFASQLDLYVPVLFYVVVALATFRTVF